MYIKSIIMGLLLVLFLFGCTQQKNISCEEQGYVHKRTVNKILNFTNELLIVTNDCLNGSITPITYYEVD